MRFLLLCVALLGLLNPALAQPLPRLKVSENRRFLVTEPTDGRPGTPFFWLGDTGWELFHRLRREEADRYLKRRAEQGFTVIQAVVLAEFDGLRTPNPYGRVPFYNDDPARPNEEYFQYVDEVLTLAERHGLYIALLPTWGDKLFKNTWGAGPEIFNPTNARAYGEWIGRRYRDRTNLIWVLGGDRNPREGTQDVEVWRQMAAGVEAGVGGRDRALMTFHPQPSPTCSSSPWFHDDDWLDFNMLQTGHCRDTPVWDLIQGDYNKSRVKPTLNGEPIYEDHPVCFNATDLGHSSAYDCRKAAYLSLFAGGFGHTYGCHDIWQFYDKTREPVNRPLNAWQDALNLPFANQIRHVRALLESRPLLERVPDNTLVVSNYCNAERVQATRGRDYLMVYSAQGKPIVLNLDKKLTGTRLKGYWFDPRKGETRDAGTFANRGQQTFTPPGSGQGQDWILVLDDEARGYPAPGKK
jgi:hypothetical protein